MTQAHESLNIMDGAATDYSTKTTRGIHLSKPLAFVILVIFALALVTASLLVYNYAACPRTDQLANVTKYELCHCDQSKLLVLPLTTERSMNVIPLDTTTPEPNPIPSPMELRLPGNVKPERYYLKITPYIFEGNFTFDGEVSVLLTVVNETDQVVFHGVELSLHEVKMYEKENGKGVVITRRTEESLRHFHILSVSEPLQVGKQYVLNITYTGILNDNLHGFYRSSYEYKGVKRLVLVMLANFRHRICLLQTSLVTISIVRHILLNLIVI